jgi:hypothetical protein
MYLVSATVNAEGMWLRLLFSICRGITTDHSSLPSQIHLVTAGKI